MKIKTLRRKIDALDSKILGLLNERAEVTLDIGKIKAKGGRAVYVPEREKDVYERLVAGNKGPIRNNSVKAIFREVMSGALSLEKPIAIAFLGPEFTFTHLASMKKFGSSVNYVGCETITDVFAEVEKSRADYGVVPIENSIEGAVNHTLDMFVESGLKMCSEVYLEISHSLLSKESDKRKIKRVYSKAEVFAQCRSWLEANLYGVELIESSSTAKAAAIASKENGSACIASELAAKRYRLKSLYKGIEDSVHNVTRFLVIGKNDVKPTKKDKTSIMFSAKDRAGALHDMLVPFKKHKINMTKIESRPSKVRPWEYYFFVDVEGHAHDTNVKKALSELAKEAAFVKVLGSYPIAVGV
ncbi:MAG: prephenate dehydratase [Candidatus Omnitrophota bacterium]|jgi:chorismate mutase/prephenate dehydratase